MTMKTSSAAIMRAVPMNYLGAPRVAFSADEPAARAEPEIPVQTSAPEALVIATDEPAADEPAEGAAEAAAEGEPEASAEPDGKKPEKVPDWLQKKMAADAFEARETARKLKAAQEEIDRLKKGSQPPAVAPTQADAAAANNAAPAGGYKSQAEFDAAVEAAASRRAAQERLRAEQETFSTRLDTIWTKGVSDFGEENFGTIAANLQSVGFTPSVDPQTGAIMNTELMQIVMETDDPSKVLYELGSDPNRAQAIMAMPPAKRAVEIAKLSVVPAAKPAPTPLSNAPRPVQPVEGSARPNGEPADNDDDATWFRKREEQLRKRGAA